MSAAALSFDRDERKELYLLLGRLDRRERLQFLAWCCQQVKGPLGVQVTSSSGETKDVWGDLVSLAGVYGFSLRTALEKLADVIRRK